MTIETSDSAASIASAEVVSGPCAHLLIHSAGLDGAAPSYGAVQVTYNGSATIPPLCLVEVDSIFGEKVVVTTQITSRSYQQTCCLYGSCCLQANAISQHYSVTFDQAVQTVTFSPPDGGQPVDADSAMDASGAIDANGAIDDNAGAALDLASGF
jgi:hypothetical protein